MNCLCTEFEILCAIRSGGVVWEGRGTWAIFRFRANSAHTRKSQPDYRLGILVKVLKNFSSYSLFTRKRVGVKGVVVCVLNSRQSTSVRTVCVLNSRFFVLYSRARLFGRGPLY